jgi:hypothetical protein
VRQRTRVCAGSWAGFRQQAENEAPAHEGENEFFFLFFNSFSRFLKAAALNQFLSKKIAFSGNGPKMKVA